MCKNNSSHFWPFRPNYFVLVTMATSNKLRELNIAYLTYLSYKNSLCGLLNRASSKYNQGKLISA